MSNRTPPVVDAGPIPLPFDDVLRTLAALEISFSRRGDGLHLTPAALLTAELRAALADHKPALLALADIRARCALLHERIVSLRFEGPPKGSSAAGLRWLKQEADKLTCHADAASLLLEDGDELPRGWQDASDPFASDAITVLFSELNELKAGLESGLYPSALPEGVDPQESADVFAAGRFLNGKPL